jgi:ubiquinone/menaquinone biosynthesis C-methylase UbiE
MSVQEAYNEWSATYDSDANLTRDLDAAVTREALDHFHFRSILELGCGTGKNTGFFSQIGERVTAVDFSAGMLKKAREKIESHHVLFCAADLARRWPIAAKSVDLVACNLVLEHIEDLAPVFSEASRVLAHGGRLFVDELHPFRQSEGSKARFQSGGATIEVAAFLHHISDFLGAAAEYGLALDQLRERWHAQDSGRLPRLVSLLFTK